MLTAKQRELLLFINQRLMATGVSPSFDEMKDALHLKSKSGIHGSSAGSRSAVSFAVCRTGRGHWR